MRRVKIQLVQLLLVSFFFSPILTSNKVIAQDLVATENIAGGSSVFVFRESQKKPQSRAGGGRVELGAAGRAGGGRSNAQIAAAAKKRRAAAIAARKQAAVRAANRKIALSNTLTVKAEGFLDANQTDLAITNFRSALAQNPKNTRASEGLSNALTAKGIDTAGESNNVAAAVYFEEAVKLDSKNDAAYAKLGAVYDAAGQSDKAVANYEKAVAINPEFSVLQVPLGVAYLKAGEIAKAESSLQKAEAGGTDTVETRHLRGLILYKQNKNPEALAAFDRVLQMDPRFAAAQYHKGLVLDRMNRTDEAIAAYKAALEADPTLASASFDLGVAYYNKGDYNAAAAAYQNAIKYDNSNAQAHANLASTYRQLERYPEANAEYQLASVGSKDPDLYSEWGYCLGKTNEWDKSVARLSTAQEMSPTAVDDSNVGWAYYNAANADTVAKNDAGAKDNYSKAKTNLKTAVDKDPKLDAAYLNLGSTHNALGEHQDAVNVLNVAVKLRPNWVIAMNQLGLGFRGLKDFVNAVAILKQVVNIDSNNTFGLFNLGETYSASGNKKEAKKINDRLKRIDPALASQLDSFISGKAVIDKVVPKVPKVPRLPF
jgi:tetratricopeptide (TPR) repeat protein